MGFWALWDNIITVSMQTLLNLPCGSKDIYGSLISQSQENRPKGIAGFSCKESMDIFW
jgi:hypothetical protein